MPIVQALGNFEHNGSRKRGQRFPVSAQVARKLRDAGLVSIAGEAGTENPKKAAGDPSSALPAARASRRATSSKSELGAKPRRRRKAEASS